MQKKTHFTFSLFLFSILFCFFDINLGLAAVAALGAYFPDLDWHLDKKIFSKTTKKVSWNLIFPVGMHRTIFHNIWILLITTWIVYYFLQSVPIALIYGFGFFSHLLADSFTKSGIYWLWPFGDERVKGSRRFHFKWHIRTGGLSEKLFSIIIVILTIVIFAWKFGFLRF